MSYLDSSSLDIAVKWAQIIAPPIAAVALIIAVLNSRPYRKRLSLAIRRGYEIENNYNLCSFTLSIIFSNMSLVPIIISEIKISIMNKAGSFFHNDNYTLNDFYTLEPGKNLSIL